jgi:hypothetical protein
MPFTVAGLNQALLADNPTFEKILRSDLHALVVMLRKTPPGFTAAMVAAEMKKISKVKWVKYSRTRAYLEREILMLTSLLRAVPTGFATIRMESADADAILRHTFKWTSDTGDLADLAQVYMREYVTWPQWPAALTACIGLPHGAEYLHPGFHGGIAANPANTGQGKDDHATIGVFNQTILNYSGAQASAPMDQVYQYSYDRVNWLPIANSSYTIVRTVTALPGNQVEIKITKTNTTKAGDTFTVRKTF